MAVEAQRVEAPRIAALPGGRPRFSQGVSRRRSGSAKRFWFIRETGLDEGAYLRWKLCGLREGRGGCPNRRPQPLTPAPSTLDHQVSTHNPGTRVVCLPSVGGGDRIHPEKRSQERLTRGTVTSTISRAAHPSGCARFGAGAGCSAIKYQSLKHPQRFSVSVSSVVGPLSSEYGTCKTVEARLWSWVSGTSP